MQRLVLTLATLCLLGVGYFLWVGERASSDRTARALGQPQAPAVATVDKAQRIEPLANGPRLARTPPVVTDEQRSSSVEREPLARLVVSVTDADGRAVPGARLDVEPRGAGAEKSSLRVAAGDAPALDDTLDVDTVGAPVQVSVLGFVPSELMLRAFADGWQPMTRTVRAAELQAGRVDIVLVLRPGASVSGRLLDGEGSAVPEGRLAFGADEANAGQEAQFTTVSHFTTVSTGRSVGRALFVAEGRRTEVGEFVLLGPGRISGRAVLGDGTPLPKAQVTATLQGGASGPGLRQGNAPCDDTGGFVLTGLAVGSFSLYARSVDSDLPDVSGRVVATGTEGYELVVDAALVTVHAVDDAREQVPMVSIQISSVVSPNTEQSDRDLGSSSISTRLRPPVESHSWLVPTTCSYVLRANGADGGVYFGFIEAGQPSGCVTVELVTRPATLGAIVLRAACPQLPADASIEVDSLEGAGQIVLVEPILPRGERKFGDPVTCEIAGLLPGSYDLSLSLANSAPVALSEGKVRVTVSAGEVREVTLEAFVCGHLELQVGTSRAIEKRTFVKLGTRVAGAAEWRPLSLSFSERNEDGEVVGHKGSRVLLGGPVARSPVLPPGEYELQLTETQHRPMTVGFRIDTGVTTTLGLQLTPAE